MQDRRIEVGSVGPNKRMNFRINLNRCEKRRIAERSVDLAREDWLQVDFSCTSVIKADPEPISTQQVYCGYAVDWMSHTASSTQGLNSIRRAPLLQAFPISHELLSVYLCPGLNHALLRSRKRSRNKVDGVDRIDRDLFLIVGMKVRAVMGTASLGVHSDNDSKKSRELGH